MTLPKTNCKSCMDGNHKDCIDENCLCREGHALRELVKEFTEQTKECLPKSPKELKKAIRENVTVSKKGRTYHIHLLDKAIQSLRPITLLEDGTRMILTYLPARTTEEGENKESTFDNLAYFVIVDANKYKRILVHESPELKEHYKISVLPSWPQARWNKKDLDKWLDEKEKTDPKILFELQDRLIRIYLDFPDEKEYCYFNIWNIATYFYELFDSFAYNDYTGTKRAGKSKALELQKHICYNSIMSADISGSATFRIIEGLGATVLLDESEQFKNQKNESAQHVRTLLNQGFLKDQYAIRSEGKANEGFTPTTFNLFSPKSLAHIKGFDDVLEDRCIKTIMKRSKNKEMLNSWPDRRNPDFEKIRGYCYRLFLDYAVEIRDLEKKAASLLSVSGRELKLWTPIITLALFFENHGVGGIVKLIQAKTIESSEDRQVQDEEESYDLRILAFCDEIGIKLGETLEELKENPLGWIPTEVFYKHLIDEETANKYGINPEYYSRRVFTETLGRLGFHRKKKKGGISWLITRKEVEDKKERMGMIEVKDPPATSSLSSFSSLSSLSGTTDTHKKEPSEPKEAGEPITSPPSLMTKSESKEVSELNENNESSLGSLSSQK